MRMPSCCGCDKVPNAAQWKNSSAWATAQKCLPAPWLHRVFLFAFAATTPLKGNGIFQRYTDCR